MPLSAKQVEYLAIAWECFESEPKIDYERFHRLAGLASASSARELLRVTKKKLRAEYGVGVGVGGAAAAVTTTTTTTTAAAGAAAGAATVAASPIRSGRAAGQKHGDGRSGRGSVARRVGGRGRNVAAAATPSPTLDGSGSGGGDGDDDAENEDEDVGAMVGDEGGPSGTKGRKRKRVAGPAAMVKTQKMQDMQAVKEEEVKGMVKVKAEPASFEEVEDEDGGMFK